MTQCWAWSAIILRKHSRQSRRKVIIIFDYCFIDKKSRYTEVKCLPQNLLTNMGQA